MTMQIPHRSLFSPAALKLWDQLDSSTQAKLLGNVWCAACRKTVHIIVESARLEKGLLLEGLCAECGEHVARLID
jgi:hypothetical protein